MTDGKRKIDNNIIVGKRKRETGIKRLLIIYIKYRNYPFDTIVGGDGVC